MKARQSLIDHDNGNRSCSKVMCEWVTNKTSYFPLYCRRNGLQQIMWATKKNRPYFPVYWLFNGAPYNGLYKSPYNWVVESHILPKQPVFFTNGRFLKQKEVLKRSPNMPKAKSSGVLRLSDARYGLWKSSPPKSFQWPAWNKKSSFQTSWQRAMMAFPLSRNCCCSDIRIILTKLMLSSLNFYMEIDGNWLFFQVFFIFQDESTIQILRLCIVCFQKIHITKTYIVYRIYTYI